MSILSGATAISPDVCCAFSDSISICARCSTFLSTITPIIRCAADVTVKPSSKWCAMPKIDRTREELDQNELAVFGKFIDKVDSMMICHGWYPCLEAQRTPASLSRRVITDLLRSEFAFDGLVTTDDLDMGAILNGYGLEQTIQLAIDAGNDLVMICHRIPEIENVRKILETLPRDQTDRALASVARFKKTMQPPHEFSEAAFRKIDSEIWDLRVATLGEERAKQRSVEDGKRSPVEIY